MKHLLLALLLVAGTAHAQTPLDLGALVESRCGPTGYRNPAGCTVRLGRGEYAIGATKLGTCESTLTQRLGVTIEGQGTSVFAAVPRYTTGGTTLVYKGPPGGTMLSVCGSRVYFRDLAVDGKGAGKCFEYRANNAHGASTHFGGIERVDMLDCATGISIFGETYNDQLDFLTFRDLTIRGGERCLVQDSQQAVSNNFDNIDCASTKEGFVVRNGSAHFKDAYTGQLGEDPTYIGFYLTKTADKTQPWMSRAMVSIQQSHMEVTHGRFIVDDSLSWYGLDLARNGFQMIPQKPDTEMMLIESTSPGPLLMLGDWVTGGGGANPVGRICHPRGPIEHMGVTVTPWVKLIWGCP